MTKSNSIKFGSNGWRGIVGTSFTEENLQRVAHAFSRYCISKSEIGNKVAVGFDGRQNSREHAETFSRILSSYGIQVILSNSVVPTPVLSYTVKKRNCTAGIMITASHNPANYNGVKFKGSYGGPFLSDDTEQVAGFLSDTIESADRTAAIDRDDFLPDYKVHLQSIVDFSALKRYAADPVNTASVLIDSMGGTGQTIIEDLLVEAGWRAQTIFGTPEPKFYDRIPEPIEQNLAPLMYNTSVTDAQFGIATDGDSDRCSIVFGDGTWMTAQENILALMWHLHTYKKMTGNIIKSASVTDTVRLLAEQWNEKVFDVNVGFSNVTDIMLAHDFMFGAEESGGFGFQHHIPERDGILSGLLFCEMVALSGKPLGELWSEIRSAIGTVYYDRRDIPAADVDRESVLLRCKEYKPSKRLEEYYIQVVRTYHDKEILNGIKYCFGDSQWLLIRISQTEPMIRIYAEGKSNEEVNKFLEEGRTIVGIE